VKPIRWTSLFAIISLAVFVGTAIVAAPLPPLGTLQPGAFRDIKQTLPVNLVFVGYEQGGGAQQISVPQFLAALPETYRAKHRLPSFYGIQQFNGVSFEYDYNVVFADQAFEDAFFTWAAANGTTGPRTLYQNLYNSEPSPPRSQTIPVSILRISAPAAEAWLAQNAPASIGVDTTRYTIFFINWWGRPDFQYHVYRKTDEPDHDTGFAFGQLSSRASSPTAAHRLRGPRYTASGFTTFPPDRSSTPTTGTSLLATSTATGRSRTVCRQSGSTAIQAH
jgi:hypothetical protein